jgi:4-hydroxy-tetrahydrodipicolinate synthase
MMTAMITPYTDDLQVNYDKAGEIAEYLCRNGSEGLVVCGTTGESPVLSHEEKLELFAVVRDSINGRIPVWAGTGSNNTAATVELSREAEKLGVDGIMLVTPYYNKPSQEGLYQHFKQVAQNISLPVMLYNIPGRSSIDLLPETVARLSEVKNIVAIKEASGNMDQMTQLKIMLPDDFLIYSGDDSMTLPMMALGAAGVVSIASHLVGNEMKKMIDAYIQGNKEEALNIHKKLFPIFRGLFITTNPVPLKEALNIMGMQVGGFRPPLYRADDKEIVTIKKMLVDFGLLV